ncbi:AMP-dependent synthetase/ligase [Antrihabitans stalactiti]|uniref:Acyl-CoA synthetase n=1 Tax=Antrihabitans stalactiti TaxID=2584121 RepID=A0A848KGN5_9NOCA|nr:AMP-dependent synthetase/ligase [Antrihabitans stalactiti]NMN95872.1 long-chain fatty acid--CoA ligase [Antrihabitans stalactiti]
MSEPQTLPQAFQRHVAERPDVVALRTLGGAVSLTWRQYGDEVRRIAGGLAALGLKRGDVFAALLTNRPEFKLTEMAANHLGATTFSIYNTCSAEQIEYLLSHSGAKIVVTEQQYVERIKASGAAVDHLLVVEDGDVARLEPAADFDFEAAWKGVQPDDVLCMIYTSGTTGPPKGVEHTHRGAFGMAGALTSALPLNADDKVISYLPSAHAADRFVCYYFGTIYGTEITTVADMKQLPAALADVHPTVFAAVPRVWEKLKIGVELQVQANELLAAGFEAGAPQVIAAIRSKLGLDRVKWAVSGAAAIPPGVFAFLQKLDIPVTDIWGMSEIGLATAATPALAKAGTVGIPLPGYETRVLEDGELLIRAPFIMKGYRNDPEKTAEAIDADGWMHTGDVVEVDDEGFLKIVDRKKELIINAGGKNMSPVNIENAISAESMLIGAVMAIGDGRPYNVALITLDPEAAPVYAAKFGLEADPEVLVKDERVIAAVQAGVDAGNDKLSRIEQIKRFTLLPTLWESGGDELTPTGKLKRKPINAKYAAEIDELYARQDA